MHTSARVTVEARAALVRQVFLDYERWPQTFPAIAGVSVVRRERGQWSLKIDHREGQVRNVLTLRADGSVVLAEAKRGYHAVFLNRFVPLSPTRSVYAVTARVDAHGWRRGLVPIAGPLVRRRLRRLTMLPLKAAAELAAGTVAPEGNDPPPTGSVAGRAPDGSGRGRHRHP